MKVSELIERLSGMPQYNEVYIGMANDEVSKPDASDEIHVIEAPHGQVAIMGIRYNKIKSIETEGVVSDSISSMKLPQEYGACYSQSPLRVYQVKVALKGKDGR